MSQVAKKTASDARRCIGRSLLRPVECPGRQRGGGADQLRAAEPRQHAVEDARIGFLVGDRAAWDSGAIAIAKNSQRGATRDPGERSDPLPLLVGGRERVLGLAGHRNETCDRVTVLRGPALGEHVAEQGGGAARA